MKHILVPTDFSDTATNAMHYAAELCKELGCEMTLIHVMHVPAVDMNAPLVGMNDLMEVQKKNEESKLHGIQEQVEKKHGIKVTSKAIYGLGSDVIVKEGAQDNTILIVMGTNGVTGILDNLLGSVSSAVVKRSETPVLVLPKSSKFSKIEKVAFAYDYKEKITEQLDFVHHLNASKNVGIDVISVEPNAPFSEEVVLDEEGVKEVSLFAPSVEEGISAYLTKENIQVLAVKRHHRSFLEELFHRSTTEELLSNGKVPLLVFN